MSLRRSIGPNLAVANKNACLSCLICEVEKACQIVLIYRHTHIYIHNGSVCFCLLECKIKHWIISGCFYYFSCIFRLPLFMLIFNQHMVFISVFSVICCALWWMKQIKWEEGLRLQGWQRDTDSRKLGALTFLERLRDLVRHRKSVARPKRERRLWKLWLIQVSTHTFNSLQNQVLG